MRMVKLLGLVVVLALLVAACSQAPAVPAATSGAAPAAKQAAATVEYPTVSFRAGSPFAATHGVHVALEKFTQNVTQRSGGKITFQLFPAGAIVTQDNALEVINRGLIDFAAYSTVVFEGELPFFAEASVAPFLYNFKSAPRVYDWLRPRLDQGLAKHSLKVLSVLPQGSGIFLSRQIDAQNPSLGGFKLRGLAGPINETLQALGASTVSMPSADIPVALRTGVVDGLYTSLASWSSLGIQSDSPYAYYTDFLVTLSTSIGMNKGKFDQLPPAAQKLIEEEALSVQQWKFAEEAKAIADIIAKAKQLPKVQPHELSPTEVVAFQKKVQPAYDKFAQKHGALATEFLNVAKQAMDAAK